MLSILRAYMKSSLVLMAMSLAYGVTHTCLHPAYIPPYLHPYLPISTYHFEYFSGCWIFSYRFIPLALFDLRVVYFSVSGGGDGGLVFFIHLLP